MGTCDRKLNLKLGNGLFPRDDTEQTVRRMHRWNKILRGTKQGKPQRFSRLTDLADGVEFLVLPILEVVTERKDAVFCRGDPFPLAVVIYPLIVGRGSNLGSITVQRRETVNKQ